MALILPMKVFLISAAVLFTALGITFSVPLVIEFLATHVLLMWSFFQVCFKPPYIYVIVNGIIFTIAASSRFHQKLATVDDPREADSVPEPTVLAVPAYEFKAQPENIHSGLAIGEPPILSETREVPPVLEVKDVVVNDTVTAEEDEHDKEIDDRAANSTWIPIKRMDSSDFLSMTERPLVSSRFSHRKQLKASPEGGKALKVSKPKRQDTLENTWKAITEGRPMPLSRHMKKSDMWENRGSTDLLETNYVKKETFKNRANQSVAASAPVKLRKEPSLSQDELNRRVEAFIKKFNEEMRLQRQQSLDQCMEMVARGSH